jgi:tRNA G10  N-methylase Trm11
MILFLFLDPFVGTGGLLIPTAHLKAISFGSEIDAR